MANLILVDYDNLDASDKRHGCVYIAEKIIKQFVPEEFNARNILIRLYGGWYDLSNITRVAQQLSNDISLNFPTTLTLSDCKTRVVVNMELAYALISQPNKHLFHTFRKRNMPTGLNCSMPTNHSQCAKNNCPTLYVHNFFKNDTCSACRLKPEDIIFRGEQKLVDTMLTSDLIFAANQSLSVGLVSSDDDLWPGILSALYTGVKVTHIHTNQRSTNSLYIGTASSNYIQKKI